MQNRRVLRIIDRLNVGGPAKHVVWLDAGLSAHGFEDILVAGTVAAGEGDMAYFAAEQGVEPMFIPEMSRELGWRDVPVIVKLVRLMRRLRPAIIHTHKSKAGAAGRIAALIYRWITPRALLLRPRTCSVVHTFHGHTFHSYFSPLRSRFFVTLERLLARYATDAIIVLSKQQLEEIHGRFQVGRLEQFRVVSLGIDLADSRSKGTVRESLGIPAGSVVVGIVGRLCAVKNHDLFLRSVARYVSPDFSRSEDVRFVVVGDGELRSELEERARALRVSQHVTFAGFRRDAAELYRAFDVVALTSRNEGTPLTLIEAMACGRPVVATEVGGVVDLLGRRLGAEPGFHICEHGLGVTSDDEDGFSAALDHLIRRPGLRAEMGERARHFAAVRFSKEVLVGEIAGVYEQLLGGGQPSISGARFGETAASSRSDTRAIPRTETC